MLREYIREELKTASSLDEVSTRIIKLFRGIHIENPSARIWYVPGIITSDGPEFQARNIEKLSQLTDTVRQQMGVLVFSATDVFDDELFTKIDSTTHAKNTDYMMMWRQILESGLVHGLVMTPRWKKSSGARDEYETGIRMGLVIKYITENGIICDNEE